MSEEKEDLINEEMNHAEESEGFENEADVETDELSADGIESDASVFLQEEEETEGFLPEVSDDEVDALEASEEESEVSVDGTELDGFDSAEIEEVEFVEEERLESIVESVLFASDRPVSLASLKLLFKGTNIRGDKIRRALDQLAVEYAGGRRGVTLEEVPGGYQLRTKIDNMEFLKRTLKARQFKLSGPALEVLSIVAYKQPTVKAEVDEIRGVESGHLLRALMEKNLVCFEGKSELPGRPMQYGTTRKFLEIFGLRSLKELPTLSQIDELLPEGIDEQQAEEKPTLATITDSMSETYIGSYSQGEEELMKIQEQLEDIATSSNFFEEEKRRQAEKRDQERAQNIRDALAFGEPVSTRDQNWLTKYDEALAAGTSLVAIAAEKKAAALENMKKPAVNAENGEEISEEGSEETLEASMDESADESVDESTDGDDSELEEAVVAFDNDEDLDEASDDQLFADSDDESSEEEELPFLGEADDIDEEGEASV
ncbi:SMC-Scp complex subunit ScpB [Bdellovibrio bacteriovorus]|uniref:SMC-Scp complex subunit ScpB n=1 Tax=Bdellovibrio bacteriovorus TaxID=959 RepID=A0A1Z3N8G8_BDEBC|nr:SMC-Scp complex subunit ScpB [Bdellovibrio bacteriovorus]ASD63737.1 SMC-Scp complex subunit ScpB [Bdellovibrio bacteriovorus]